MKLPRLPKRKPDSHKGDYGRVLIVAGSTGMCGAATLASEAAYRSGAGLVYLAVPSTLVPILSVKQTCAVVRPLPDSGDGHLGIGAAKAILALARECDVIAIGPGLGFSAEVPGVTASVAIPLIIDADGLNAFADKPDDLARGPAPKILTPHPGELSRLTSERPDRKAWARESAERFRAIVVLKGHETVVTDGKRLYVNDTGNPGMATGGAGDVLTGVIAALIGQKLDPFDAAVLGVNIHGLAGDLAAKKFGEVSMIATDIIDALPFAFMRRS